MTFFAMNVNESKNFFSKYYFISIHILTKVPVKNSKCGGLQVSTHSDANCHN